MTEHRATSGPPSHRVAAVVYNPVKVDLAAVKAEIASAEKSAGWAPTLWFETTKDDAGQGPTAEALDAGAIMVIAAGGDGTVRAVAEAMYDSDASLALLPSGTGNLLARNLKLPLDDLASSAHTAFAGRDRRIDLPLIDIRHDDQSISRHVYLVMAGLGLDATMLANTNDDLKKKVGWLAYAGALGGAMLDKNQLHLRYNVDGTGNRSVHAHTIIIGNCGSLPGNVLLLPDAAIDDEMFELVLLRPRGAIGWLQITTKILWESGVLRRTEAGRKFMGPAKEIRALCYIKGREVVVRLERPHDIELDGDSFGSALALKTWIEPGALTVRVPILGSPS